MLVYAVYVKEVLCTVTGGIIKHLSLTTQERFNSSYCYRDIVYKQECVPHINIFIYTSFWSEKLIQLSLLFLWNLLNVDRHFYQVVVVVYHFWKADRITGLDNHTIRY